MFCSPLGTGFCYDVFFGNSLWDIEFQRRFSKIIFAVVLMILVLGFLSARPHCDVPDKGTAYSDISTDEKYKAKHN